MGEKPHSPFSAIPQQFTSYYRLHCLSLGLGTVLLTLKISVFHDEIIVGNDGLVNCIKFEERTITIVAIIVKASMIYQALVSFRLWFCCLLQCKVGVIPIQR